MKISDYITHLKNKSKNIMNISVILISVSVIIMLTIRLLEEHYLQKNQIEKSYNKVIRNTLSNTIKIITTKYKQHIMYHSEKDISSSGCVLKLQLNMKNGKKLHIHCAETYFLVCDSDEIKTEQQDINSMEAYIVSHCDTVVSDTVVYLEEYRRHG